MTQSTHSKRNKDKRAFNKATTMVAVLKRKSHTVLSWAVVACLLLSTCAAFTSKMSNTRCQVTRAQIMMSSEKVSRRRLIQSVPLVAATVLTSSQPVLAAEKKDTKASSRSLESLLLTILRVKEATIQVRPDNVCFSLWNAVC